MTSPAAPLRGGAVGALTVALAIAAHGSAGGGYPAGSALVFLLVVAVGIGAVVSVPRPGSAMLLSGLMLGQVAAHAALAVAGPHEHALLPSPSMLLFHLAASFAAAGLVGAAERLYGPITTIVRAVLDPPRPLPARTTVVGSIPPDHRRPRDHSFTTSISRRGPPNPIW